MHVNISYAVVQVSAMYARIPESDNSENKLHRNLWHTHTYTYAYTHFHTHAHTMIWLRPELREHSSLTLACSSTFFTLFWQIYYYNTFISSNSQTSQYITNIFEYSNILHQILDIRIRILNFLVTNIFNIRIRPII